MTLLSLKLNSTKKIKSASTAALPIYCSTKACVYDLKPDSYLSSTRLQQDPSLLPSESSPESSHQERRHHPHLLPTSPHHLGSPEASDSSTGTEHRGTGASTPEISVSSDSEFES